MAFLLDWLIEKYPKAKRQTLKRMVEAGRVTINGKLARRLKEPLKDGDVIATSEAPKRVMPSLHPLKIVHEDDDILVINKPAGLLTSTVATERRPTAAALVQAYVLAGNPKARCGIIHRLDRDASGLLVFSKNNHAYEDLKHQFFAHTVQRVYTAVVHGKPSPPSGRIESNLVEMPDGSMQATGDPKKGQHAITEYKVIGRVPNHKWSLVQVTLHTGRKHQIRFHMNQRGWPIVGDTVYGADRPPHPNLLLVATHLGLTHPTTGKPAVFDIPLPTEMRKVMGKAESQAVIPEPGKVMKKEEPKTKRK